MKRKMSPRKKYANGTNTQGVGPNNYIQTPNEVLNDYNIMLAETDKQVASNSVVPIVSLVGGLLQQGISMAGSFKKTPVTPPSNSAGVVAANGMNNVNSNVEVEGGEMYETPQGETGEFEGPSHEQGGIPLEVGEDVEEGTKIYSDRLKVGKETLAERKEARERKIANLEKIASQPLIDAALKNATQRKMMAIQKEEMADLQFQEQVNNMQQMADTMVKAFGTSMAGLEQNPIGDSMRYGSGTGAMGVTEYGGGTGPDGLPSDFRFTDYDQYGNLILKPGTIGTAKFPKDIVGSADYETDVLKNFHNEIGITPDTPGYGKLIGEKSALAYNNWAKKNYPDHYRTDNSLLTNFYGSEKSPAYTGDMYSKYLRNSKSEEGLDVKKALNLTPEGYKYNPQEPDMTGLVKQDEPFVEPTGVLAGMEKYYQDTKAKELEQANPPGTMFSRGLEKGLGAIGKQGGIPGIGDLAGLFGNYLGATAGLKNAAESRSTDVTHTNVYQNAGKETQKQLDNAMSSIEGSKAQAIVKATTNTQGSKRSGRNSARGVNQMRGMDWLYDTALNQQVADISANAANQVADIYKTKASTAMSVDQLKGQGQYQANMANEAAKDAYYTAKGMGLKDQSLALQQMGKDINARKENKVKWNIAKKSGTYGQGNDEGDIENKQIEFIDPSTNKKVSLPMLEFQKLMAKYNKSN